MQLACNALLSSYNTDILHIPDSSLCTCDKQTSNKSTLAIGDFTFENQSDYNDYNDLVRLQTRNAAKRRTSSSRQQSFLSQQFSHEEPSRGRRRQRHLQKLEEQQERSSSDFDALPQASSVSEFSHSSRASSDYTSSFEPALLAAKLNALLAHSPEYSPTFPSVDSLPSLHLDSGEDEDETDEETDIEEAHGLTKMQARELPLHARSEAESRFERALAFAKWNKRGRAGVWESPEGVSETVRELVASVEMSH